MLCICCLIQNGPPTAPTAFPLSGPQCTVGVLAGTHWGALRCPGRMASGTKRQPLSAALLHCCCTAEPVLTRATKHTPSVKHKCRGFWPTSTCDSLCRLHAVHDFLTYSASPSTTMITFSSSSLFFSSSSPRSDPSFVVDSSFLPSNSLGSERR